jgi:triacylglycerol lipase
VLHEVVILLTMLLGAAALASLRGFAVHEVDRQRRMPWTATRHAVLARETVARVLFLVTRPLGWGEPRAWRVEHGVPVVLVPDPGVGRAALLLLRQFLRNQGFDAWILSFPRGEQSLAERADSLDERLTHLMTTAEVDRVDLVAFGVGGLVAAWFVRHRDQGRRVRRLVTLGTPWRGTRLAVFWEGSIAEEARPDSHALDDLLSPEVPTLSVWCPEDPEVVPPESARADAVDSVAVEGAGHLGLLLSARTFRAVLTGLQRTLPEAA